MSDNNNGQGYVVIKDGQRDKSFNTESEARKEAERLKKLNEGKGEASPSVEVKQNLMG